jgi:hypothetical protein
MLYITSVLCQSLWRNFLSKKPIYTQTNHIGEPHHISFEGKVIIAFAGATRLQVARGLTMTQACQVQI